MIKNPISTAVGILVALLIGTAIFGAFYGVIDQPRRAEEIQLQQNLWAVRRAIDFYSTDKEKQPKSLQELVDTGYLPEIPIDPLTKSNKTWLVQNASTSSGQPAEVGIIDVHSAAPGADASGKPYNQY